MQESSYVEPSLKKTIVFHLSLITYYSNISKSTFPVLLMCHFDAVICNCLAAQMTQAQLWNISTRPKQRHATFISLIA